MTAIVHGTRSAYCKGRCRCAECCLANTKYRREMLTRSYNGERISRPIKGVTLPCGACGSQLSAGRWRAHFTRCPKRPA